MGCRRQKVFTAWLVVTCYNNDCTCILPQWAQPQGLSIDGSICLMMIFNGTIWMSSWFVVCVVSADLPRHGADPFCSRPFYNSNIISSRMKSLSPSTTWLPSTSAVSTEVYSWVPTHHERDQRSPEGHAHPKVSLWKVCELHLLLVIALVGWLCRSYRNDTISFFASFYAGDLKCSPVLYQIKFTTAMSFGPFWSQVGISCQTCKWHL